MIDFDAIVHGPMTSVFASGETITYSPALGTPPFAITGIFDRHHDVVMDEMSGSELNAAGHSTTLPVLSVRLNQFPVFPKSKDQVTIGTETFAVWDVQPDGHGMADLILRALV